VAQPPSGLSGEPGPQFPADLLRTPPLVQQRCDELPQLGVGLDASAMTASPTGRRPSVRLEGTIAAVASGVAAQFT
jgi:hypothetical protein